MGSCMLTLNLIQCLIIEWSALECVDSYINDFSRILVVMDA